jgi:hypothetical protein
MKAKNFDKKFDDGKDISKYLKMSKANVDFPLWIIHFLDKEAKRLGVPRQSIIKVWVAEHIEKKVS